MKLNVLSLFSGIGAFEKALTNLNIPYNLINFSEIDKYAVKSYSAIHNILPEKNLGDITKISPEILLKLPEVDLLTHGSPCTNFSLAGKQAGGDEGSGTASSLMWYSVNIIKLTKPKVVIWENVANVLSKRHKHNFDKYLTTLSDFGYNSTFAVLNAKDFGVPQYRKRLICISILKSATDNWLNKNFNFSSIEYRKPVAFKDIMDKNYDKSMVANLKMTPEIKKSSTGIISVGQTSSKNSQAGKVYSIEGLFPTLCACTHGYAIGFVLVNGIVRRITPTEAFKLMGFTQEDCEKCQKVGISKTQLYKQAGNSIVVPMIEEIFKKLIKKA